MLRTSVGVPSLVAPTTRRRSSVSHAQARILLAYEPFTLTLHGHGVGDATSHVFKTETQKLLHIVANSLYSEKEVFVRELVSNAADALEKLRYMRMSGATSDAAGDAPLEIRLFVDPEAKTFTIQDTGVGMTEQELNDHLGTIARSGSKSFIERLEESGNKNADAREKIIGQFGVGFYSSFMVGDRVRVYTRSAQPDAKGYCWSSDGTGAYTIAEAEHVDVGTKIVVELRDQCLEFADRAKIEGIVFKYSNFVGFPIYLNGKKINTVEALWTMASGDKSSISDEQHTEFYRFVASTWDRPRFRLHYKTDAPLSINSLLYVPGNHAEQFGMERMDPGVSLYSRKVLIQSKSAALLPGWLRFVKGVIDSEDIPLNLSREMLQDSALIKRLRDVMTQRICKWLEEEARRNPEKYNLFARDFGVFLKEGVCTDASHKDAIGKLLRFESSALEKGKVTSFKEYIARMPESQAAIYYLCVPNREYGDESPYSERFKQQNIEILYLYDSVDEFVMHNLGQVADKPLVSIDSQEALKALTTEQPDAADVKAGQLTDDQADTLATWMLGQLGTTLSTVKPSKRLVSHPAIVVDPESPTLRRMMQMVSSSNKGIMLPQNPVNLEINPNHPVIYGLYHAREQRPDLAKEVAEQIVVNAQIAAGVLDDPRSMLKRLNHLLATVLESQAVPELPPSASSSPSSTTAMEDKEQQQP
ncbi:TNF receptor-associated protein 1, isoform CRA_d [Syncephalis pseudoplumigaleata]|uniref:TNF receptor-associated protein 1, isoform CRA_d n=1 Tax=Syncephalis pseudoplumigaleata TaxID=1712513 RepID=A0A4P9YZT5_9FUNG|nr:TNF receptor-associated protein 1, isoform CRA_d [Syncephalis pseudoplumigaleata]|eukprot:RKP25624.1 TNF receptor-associated protein 1, isoform CRA_d [Syncephalis pseudoplumigaleata]